MRGEMTSTITLRDADGATELVAVHEGLAGRASRRPTTRSAGPSRSPGSLSSSSRLTDAQPPRKASLSQSPAMPGSTFASSSSGPSGSAPPTPRRARGRPGCGRCAPPPRRRARSPRGRRPGSGAIADVLAHRAEVVDLRAVGGVVPDDDEHRQAEARGGVELGQREEHPAVAERGHRDAIRARDRRAERGAEAEADGLKRVAEQPCARVGDVEVHRRPAGERAGVDGDRAIGGQQVVQRDGERARVDRAGRRGVVVRLVAPAARGDRRRRSRRVRRPAARWPRASSSASSARAAAPASATTPTSAGWWAPIAPACDVDLDEPRPRREQRAVARRPVVQPGAERQRPRRSPPAARRRAARRSRRRCRARRAGRRTGRGPSPTSPAARRSGRPSASMASRAPARTAPRPAMIAGRSRRREQVGGARDRRAAGPRAARAAARASAGLGRAAPAAAARSIGIISTTGRRSSCARRSARAASAAARRGGVDELGRGADRAHEVVLVDAEVRAQRARRGVAGQHDERRVRLRRLGQRRERVRQPGALVHAGDADAPGRARPAVGHRHRAALVPGGDERARRPPPARSSRRSCRCRPARRRCRRRAARACCPTTCATLWRSIQRTLVRDHSGMLCISSASSPPERNRHADRHHRPARRPRRRRRARGRPDAAAQRAHAGDRAAADVRQHAAALAPHAQPLRRRRPRLGVGRARARRAHRHPPRRADPLDHRPRRRRRRLDPRRAPRRPRRRHRPDRRGARPTRATCSRSPTSRPSRPSTARCRPAAGCCFAPAGAPARRTPRPSSTPGRQGPVTPGPDADAALWLATERDIVGFGVETVGIDAGAAGGFDPPFPVHHHLLGNDRYGLTQLANLEQLPVTGAVDRRRAAAARRRDRQPGAGARAGAGVT